MYDLWQYLHVVTAAVWFGSAALTLFLSFRLGAITGNPVAAAAAGLVESKAVPVFVVTSLLTFITGLIMAFGWIGFEPLWIKIGLVGILISLVVGVAYFKPHGAKIEAAVMAGGPNDPEARRLMRQGQLVSLVELVLLLIVVWAMVVKPA